ncbi:MAG TPA: site-specific integrase, partial [Phyllobacterium sp.]|nr:site-specific integrase [Phyllobacterium sp.]
MPRISKGPRLYKRKAKRKNGRLVANAVWTIRDGEREVATGIFAGEAERKPPKTAEDALAKYITSKYQPSRRTRDIEDIDIADVLAIYHAHRESIYLERKAKQTDITEFADRIGRLNDFFGGMMLVEVNAHTCAKYVKARGRRGGARRDLEDLRAAINHHSREGLHRGLVRVALPAKGPGRDRWLTRSEAAALLWACWRYREVQTQHRGALKNQKIETDKR